MLLLGGKAMTIEEGMKTCRGAVASGKAYRKFKELVERQGGDASFIEHPEKYRQVGSSVEVRSSTSGDLDRIDALELGFTAVVLGAGRTKVDDEIQPGSGILLKKKIGDSVDAGDTLAVIYGEDNSRLEQARHRVERAFSVATEPSTQPPLIHAIIDEHGVTPWRGGS
jgi:pyrimidine-nucleoside phosphorylase